MATAKPRIPRVTPLQVELEREPLSPKAWLAIVASIPLILGAWALWAQSFEMPEAEPLWRMNAGNYDIIAEAALKAETDEIAKADLIMLGTSREIAGLWAEPRLEAALGAAVGRPIEVADLNAYRIRPMDTLYLSTLMDKPKRVLIPVNPQSFAWPKDISEHLREINFIRPPLDFIEAYKGRFPELEPYSTGFPRLELQMKTKRRLLRRLTTFRLDSWAMEHIYGGEPDVRDPLGRDAVGDLGLQKRHRENWLVRRMLVFDENQHWNADILGAVIEVLEAKGAEVALMECAVMDEDPRTSYEPWWPDYKARLVDLSAKYDVPVFDFNDQVELDAFDFVDSTHMGEPGRDKFSPLFVAAMAKWIQGEAP